MRAAGPLFELREAALGQGRRPVLQIPHLALYPGEATALLGPNGVGKSTLLRSLLGLTPLLGGELLLGGRPMGELPRREVARRLAFVPQDRGLGGGFAVWEILHMARYPYLGRWTPLRPADRRIVRAVAERLEIGSLLERPYDHLSGGEQQRVLLAAALAQEPEGLLLDEPTASLDLAFQVRTMATVETARAAGLCVVATLHDPNLAAGTFDRVLILDGGRIVADGPPEEVLRVEVLEPVYRTRLEEAALPSGRRLLVPALPVRAR